MKNFIILFLLFFNTALLIPDVNNNEENHYYLQNINDTTFILNSTDSLKELSYYIKIYDFPNTHNIKFIDGKNNILNVNVVTSIEYGYVFDKIISKYIITYNNNPILLCGFFKCNENSNRHNFNYSVNYIESSLHNYIIDYYYNGFTFKNRISFDTNNIEIERNTLSYILNSEYNKNSNYFYKIYIDNNTYSDLNIVNINKNIAYVSNSISEQYNDLNPILKIVFSVFKGIIYIFSLIFSVNEIEYLNYQDMLLIPLSMLNFFINGLIISISFILKFGILLALTLVILLIIIYSFSKNKNDFLNAFKDSINNIISFLEIILKPLIWIFNKIIELMQTMR